MIVSSAPNRSHDPGRSTTSDAGWFAIVVFGIGSSVNGRVYSRHATRTDPGSRTLSGGVDRSSSALGLGREPEMSRTTQTPHRTRADSRPPMAGKSHRFAKSGWRN